jgi:splicing factor 3B subunit 3
MSVLALSSRSWLNYTHQGLVQFDPLIYEPLDHACGLSAEVCPEGVIGITGDTLRYVPLLGFDMSFVQFLTSPPVRIFTFSKLGQKVKQDAFPLPLTPRRIVFHPDASRPLLYAIGSDNKVLPFDEQKRLLEVSFFS